MLLFYSRLSSSSLRRRLFVLFRNEVNQSHIIKSKCFLSHLYSSLTRNWNRTNGTAQQTGSINTQAIILTLVYYYYYTKRIYIFCMADREGQIERIFEIRKTIFIRKAFISKVQLRCILSKNWVFRTDKYKPTEATNKILKCNLFHFRFPCGDDVCDSIRFVLLCEKVQFPNESGSFVI